MTDLKERLLTMYSHRGDGIPTQYVNPDGPEAAAELERLEAEIEAQRGITRLNAKAVIHQLHRAEAAEAKVRELEAEVEGQRQIADDAHKALWAAEAEAARLRDVIERMVDFTNGYGDVAKVVHDTLRAARAAYQETMQGVDRMSQPVVTDHAYKRILEDPRLERARRKLSLHEIRQIVQHVRAADRESSCPFCSKRNSWSGDPAKVFCEDHYRQFRATGGI